MNSLWLVAVYLLAGLAEIGGGYLVWHWLRSGRPLWWGLAGGVILVLYGVIAAQQPAGFSKVYATYGGVFVVMSVLWGMVFDGQVPSRQDWVGLAFILIGILFMISQSNARQ